MQFNDRASFVNLAEILASCGRDLGGDENALQQVLSYYRYCILHRLA